MQAAVLPVVAVAAGIFALVKGAGLFVRGTSACARLLGLPPLLVGMVVVGFGTSAPELAVSAMGAWSGSPELALGNAWGSNICNVALVLGLCAVVRPLVVKASAWRFDIPVVVAVTAASGALLVFPASAPPGLSRGESFLLLAAFLVAVFVSARRQISGVGGLGPRGGAANAGSPPSGRRALRVAAFQSVAGLVALVVSSKILVWGAASIARALRVGELVIGLTVVAVGTSLPELASSIAAVRRGEDDLAVGNILGSNLFNALAVVGLAGAISPMPSVAPEVLQRDIPFAFLLAALLFSFGRPVRGGDGRLGRAAGSVFLALYCAYVAVLAVFA